MLPDLMIIGTVLAGDLIEVINININVIAVMRITAVVIVIMIVMMFVVIVPVYVTEQRIGSGYAEAIAKASEKLLVNCWPGDGGRYTGG